MPIISGGGGGGGLPLTGGTLTGPLVIRSDTGITVKNTAGTVTHFASGNGSSQLIAGAAGTTSVITVDTGKITLKDETGAVMVDIEGSYVSLGTAGEVVITPSNYLALTSHAAIASAEVDAGMLTFWFDQTNGAAKLMVKAKSADGTVAVGSLALT